jgi:hypothetical protein
MKEFLVTGKVGSDAIPTEYINLKGKVPSIRLRGGPFSNREAAVDYAAFLLLKGFASEVSIENFIRVQEGPVETEAA